MKNYLQKLFWPILVLFERNNQDYIYKPSYRKITLVVGILFLLLSIVAAYFISFQQDIGFYIPVVVFFLVGLVSLVVGGLGSEKAIAKIWGNQK